MTGSADGATELRGATAHTVRRALEGDDPLPGTAGFAGRLGDALVRDVLGRQPLFVEAGTDSPIADGNWSFGRDALTDPERVPAGHRRSADGTERVWSLPSPEPVINREAAVEDVRRAVRASIDRLPTEGLAVAFSGGVDSAVIAALTDAPLYVTGFPESHDVEAARSAATALDRELQIVEIDHDDVVDAVTRIAAATGRRNAMDVAIAIPLLLTAERAAADGYDALAVGQGADELFGGYAKVAKAPSDPRVEADTVRGARRETLTGLPEQLERDVLTIRSAGIEPVAPYLHDDVVAAALALPGDALVTEDGQRKWALRNAASEWLPADIVERDKKAMQYGSLVSRELDRLARQAGFKRRMDDHVGQYVDSLCETGE